MLFWFIDNIFVQFDGLVFQQTPVMVLYINNHWLLCFLTLMRQTFLQNKYGKLAQTLNSIFRYIDAYDVLSLNNSRFGDYLHLIYPNEEWYYWHSKICFLPWHPSWNRQRRDIYIYKNSYSIFHTFLLFTQLFSVDIY